MKKTVMLSLVALAGAPMSALADAVISDKVGNEIKDWTGSDRLRPEGENLLSPDGTAISQVLKNIWPGKYTLTATTTVNAEISVNGQKLGSNGEFTIASTGDIVITVSAKTANQMFVVGGFNLELKYDFDAEHLELSTPLSAAFVKVGNLSNDARRTALNAKYRNDLLPRLQKLKSKDNAVLYDVYGDEELYEQDSKLSREISQYVIDVDNAVANDVAWTKIDNLLSDVKKKWDVLDAERKKEGNYLQATRDYIKSYVDAINTDLTDYRASIKEVYDAGYLHNATNYSEAKVTEKCNQLEGDITKATANLGAYDRVTRRINEANTKYEEAVQNIVKHMDLTVFGGDKSLSEAAQGKLSAELARIGAVKANNDIYEIKVSDKPLVYKTIADREGDNTAAIDVAIATINAHVADYNARYDVYAVEYSWLITGEESIDNNVKLWKKALAEMGNTQYDKGIGELEGLITKVKNILLNGMKADKKLAELADYTTEKKTLQTKYADLETKTDKVIGNHTSYLAFDAEITKLRAKLETTKTEVEKLKSADGKGNYTAAGRWTITPNEIKKALDGFKTGLDNAYAAQTCKKYKEDNWESLTAYGKENGTIDQFLADAKATVARYEVIWTAKEGWKVKLADIKKYIAAKDYAVTCSATNKSYGTMIKAIESAINTAEAGLTKALDVNANYDKEHKMIDRYHKDFLETKVSSEKPAEIGQINKEDFEVDKKNFQETSTVSAANSYKEYVTQMKNSLDAQIQSILADYGSVEKIGLKAGVVSTTCSTLSEALGDVVISTDDITKENASAMLNGFMKNDADLAVISDKVIALETDAMNYKKAFEANNNKYKELINDVKPAEGALSKLLGEIGKIVTEDNNPDDTSKKAAITALHDADKDAYDKLAQNILDSKNDETLIAKMDGAEGYTARINKLASDIKAHIAKAEAADANWKAYQDHCVALTNADFDTKFAKAVADVNNREIVPLAVADNEEGIKYYLNTVIGSYASVKGSLREERKNLVDEANKAYKEDKSTSVANFSARVNTLKTKIGEVAANAKTNEDKYKEHLGKKSKVAGEWTSAYNRISNEDKTGQLESYLESLAGIQRNLNTLNAEVENYHQTGKSAEENTNVTNKYTEYSTGIKNLLAQWEGGYDATVQKENDERYAAFQSALEATNKTYIECIKNLGKFAGLVDLDAELYKLVLTAHETIYPLDTKINNLLTKAQAEKEEATGSKTYDLNEANKKAAEALKTDIMNAYTTATDKLNVQSKNTLGDAINAVTLKLNAAKAAIDGYYKAVKDVAFQDVDKLLNIAKSDKDHSNEVALNMADGKYNTLLNLKTIESMLNVDKENAAQKQYAAYLADYQKKVTDDKATLNMYINKGYISSSVLTDYDKAIADHIEKAGTGVKALAAEAMKNNNMFGKLSGIQDQFRLFRDNCGYNTGATNIESLKAYDTFCNTTVVELEKLLGEKQAYANDYVAINGEIINCENKLSKIKADAKKLKDDGLFEYKDGSSIKDDCSKLKEQIKVLNVSSDKAQHSALLSEINDLKGDYNQALAWSKEHGGDKAEEIKAYEPLVEQYRKQLTDIPTKYEKDEAARHQAYIALEKEIAKSRTELYNIYSSVESTYDALNALLATINETLGNQNTYLGTCHSVVQNQFDGRIPALQAESATIAEDIDARKDAQTLVTYEKNIKRNINSLDTKVKDLIAEIKTAQAPFDKNNAVKTALDNKIKAIRDYNDALVKKFTEYEHVKVEAYKETVKSELEQLAKEEKAITTEYQETDPTKVLNDAKQKAYEENLKGIENEIKKADKDYCNVEATGQINDITNAKKELFKFFDSNDVAKKEDKDAIKNTFDDIDKRITKMSDLQKNVYIGNAVSKDLDGNLLKPMVDGKEQNVQSHEEGYPDFINYITPGIIERVAGLYTELDALNEELDAKCYRYGDANLDRKITVTDYQKILNHVLGVDVMEEGSLALDAADVNKDKTVDIGDITSVVKLINNTSVNHARYFRAVSLSSKDNIMLTSEGEGTAQRIAINLNSAQAYYGAQMDITLPKGIKLVDAVAADRANGLTLYNNDLGNGTVRLILSSLEEAAIAEGEGAIIYLDVEVDHNYNGEGIPVSDVKFTDANATVHRIAAIDGDNTTGIGSVTVTEEIKQKVYSVGGMLMDGLKRGINIIRNSDGTSKKVIK